jgi:hypothetical protein
MSFRPVSSGDRWEVIHRECSPCSIHWHTTQYAPRSCHTRSKPLRCLHGRHSHSTGAVPSSPSRLVELCYKTCFVNSSMHSSIRTRVRYAINTARREGYCVCTATSVVGSTIYHTNSPSLLQLTCATGDSRFASSEALFAGPREGPFAFS